MPFVKGQSGNPVGRPKGSISPIRRTVKAAFEDAFEALQKPKKNGDPNPAALTEWAQANPTEFYKLAKALIPQKLEHEGGIALTVATGVPPAEDDLSEIA